jgi:hypothetical protein
MDVFTACPDGSYPTLARQLGYRAKAISVKSGTTLLVLSPAFGVSPAVT